MGPFVTKMMCTHLYLWIMVIITVLLANCLDEEPIHMEFRGSEERDRDNVDTSPFYDHLNRISDSGRAMPNSINILDIRYDNGKPVSAEDNPEVPHVTSLVEPVNTNEGSGWLDEEVTTPLSSNCYSEAKEFLESILENDDAESCDTSSAQIFGMEAEETDEVENQEEPENRPTDSVLAIWIDVKARKVVGFELHSPEKMQKMMDELTERQKKKKNKVKI